MENSKVYIKIDSVSRVIAIDGGYTKGNIKDLSEWIFVDEGIGDKYNLCQNNYLPGPLTDENGIYLYKYVEGSIVPRSGGSTARIVERTQDEIADDYRALPFEIDKLSLLLDAIPVDNKPTDRPGYMWKPIFNLANMKVGWEEVVDPDYNPTGSGTYVDPYVYEDGMTVEIGMWYTDGDNIWEAIKTGIPTGFDDSEYFDIITA